MDETFRLIGSFGYMAIVLFANMFVVLYTLLARWWKSEFGRHLFFFMLAEATLLDHGLIVGLFGEYPGVELMRAILLWGLAFVMAWRVYLLVKVQIITRRNRRQMVPVEE